MLGGVFDQLNPVGQYAELVTLILTLRRARRHRQKKHACETPGKSRVAAPVAPATRIRRRSFCIVSAPKTPMANRSITRIEAPAQGEQRRHIWILLRAEYPSLSVLDRHPTPALEAPAIPAEGDRNRDRAAGTGRRAVFVFVERKRCPILVYRRRIVAIHIPLNTAAVDVVAHGDQEFTYVLKTSAVHGKLVSIWLRRDV
jgi:hypothetical protein